MKLEKIIAIVLCVGGSYLRSLSCSALTLHVASLALLSYPVFRATQQHQLIEVEKKEPLWLSSAIGECRV